MIFLSCTYRHGSSIIDYDVEDSSPVTDEEISQTTAELSNFIDNENNTLVIGGVPVPLLGNPALIENFDTDQEQQSK